MTQLRYRKELQKPRYAAARRLAATRAPISPSAAEREGSTCPHLPREPCDCDKLRDEPPCSLCKWIDACHDPDIHTENEGDPS
jgi:hypothetical protein